MDKLVFSRSPAVTFATNVFVNVPTILQFDDTPLISIVQEEKLGFTSEIPIYHSDGTYLAKVRGTRIFETDGGKKAGLTLSHPQGMTVCTLDGKTIFEIHHQPGNAFKTTAELFAPKGYFVKSSDAVPFNMGKPGEPLQVGGLMMSHCMIQGARIGVWLRSNGSCSIGCN